MKNFKNSGIEWLGEIPEHWEVVKIKHIFNIGRGRVISQEELDENGNFPVYSSQTTNNGILGYIKTYDFDCEQITWTTDGVNAGTIFLRNGKYNCTNVCGILKPRNNENMSFLTYALQNVTPYYKRPDTNGAKIMNNEMANIQIVYPPLKEQEQIANFLDEKCEKIANFIEKKEKLLSLLQEQKQALINETITKGLDKNVKFKNSGIEWLGEIPEHWEMVRLGLILKTGSGTTPNSNNDKYYKEGEIVWINSGDLNDSCLRDSKRKITSEALNDYPILKIFDKNSLIIAMYGATIGKIAILKVNACVNQACCVLEKSTWYATSYLFYWFKGCKKELISMGSGGGQPNISQDIIKNLKIPILPLKEQEQIANFLDEKCEKIDSLITKIKKQIELIKEYKTTLINEAVCGRMGKS
ncbi:restriction endonuclease subunit S [Campylobacter sp. B0100352/1]|uniref:restriction endonuclease subunit S n=1 Tax=Campylobacter sp. B0100352/1 TaxID=2735783 RepID=UPI001D9B8998|nr:restriction endonuclease subunit S [Campylobacter sp. B0100352/1]